MSEQKKYVILIEHLPLAAGGEELTYFIKDKEVRTELTNYKETMELYRGKAGHNESSGLDDELVTDGALDLIWLKDSNTVAGIYSVLKWKEGDLTLSINNATINSLWDTTSTTAALELANYIVTSTYSHVDTITFPALLILGEIQTLDNGTSYRAARLIDAKGIAWLLDNTTWINLYDDKANIADFRSLCTKVKAQEALIDELITELSNLSDRIDSLEAVQDYVAEPVNDTSDDDGNIIATVTNVLIIGDRTNFNNRIIANEILKKLNLNGTVVWIRNGLTKDAISYFGTYEYDGEQIPVTLKPTGTDIYFSNNKVNGKTVDSLKVTDFSIVIIMANKEDIYETNPTKGYGYIKNGLITDMLGNTIPGDVVNVKTTGADVAFYDTSGGYHTDTPSTNHMVGDKAGWVVDQYGNTVAYRNTVATKIYVTYEYNTFSAYASQIITQILKLIPKVVLRYVSPITWEKNSTTTLTSTQRTDISTFEKKIKELCAAAGIKYYETRMIGSVQRKTYLGATGQVINTTAIDNYIEDLCKVITDSLPSGTKYTVQSADEKLKTIKHTNKTVEPMTDPNGDTVYKFKNSATSTSTSYIFNAPSTGSGTFTYTGYLTAKKSVTTGVTTSCGLLLYHYDNSTKKRGSLIGEKWFNELGASGNIILKDTNSENVQTIVWDTDQNNCFELQFAAYTSWNGVSRTLNQQYTATYTYDWEVDFTTT